MNILSICSEPSIMEVMRIVMLLINIIKVVVPIILIISLMIKFAGAVTKNDQDLLNKAAKEAIPSAIAAVLIFLVPTFVDIVVRLTFPNSEYTECISNISVEKVAEAYVKKMDKIIEDAYESESNADYANAKMYLQNIKDKTKRAEYEVKLKELEEIINKKTSPSGGSGSSIDNKTFEITSTNVVDTVVNIQVTTGAYKVAGYYFSNIEKVPDINGFDWIDTDEKSFKVTKFPGTYYVYVKDTSGKIIGGRRIEVPKVFNVEMKTKGRSMMPVTLATYLKRHGSSVEELNTKIATYNVKHGLKTRESVVVGAMAFMSEVQSWGYYLPYSGSNENAFGSKDEDIRKKFGVYKYWGGGEKTFIACNPFVIWSFKNAGLNIYGSWDKIRHDITRTTRITARGLTEYELTVRPATYESDVHIYRYFVGALASKSSYGDNIIPRNKARSGDVLQSYPSSGHEMLIVDKYDDNNDGVSDGYIVLQSRDIGHCYEKVPYKSVVAYDMTNVYNNTAGYASYLRGWQQYHIPESDYPDYIKALLR